tara:strand:- start:5 stop:643 length:639 start_codon:yes stop_codon:yes gene_type:complete
MSAITDLQEQIDVLDRELATTDSLVRKQEILLERGALQVQLDACLTLSNSDVFSGGLFDYNDVATAGTPIAITGTAAATTLTNDGAGAFTNKTYLPLDVTDVWNAALDTFDWSELKLGDMIDIRIDIDVTTTSVNTEVKVDLELGTGGGAYSVPWASETNYKTTGTHKINIYNGIYMGDANTLNNGGTFTFYADKDCSVVVNGWYCKIIKRG